MMTGKELGDIAEFYALELLEARGYSGRLLPTNYPTFDIEISSERSFRVSVKASAKVQHVRLGSISSVSRLTVGSFVFAFVPAPNSKELKFEPDGYQLLIVPGEIAKGDGLALSASYITEKNKPCDYVGSGVMVKGYSRRPHQVEVWSKWQTYVNAWSLLPSP